MKKILNTPEDLPFLKDPPPEMHENIYEIVTDKGFKIEEHQVITDDGYILTIFRIPSTLEESKNPTGNNGKAPLLFMHGLADSAIAWVVNAPDKAPALVAAMAGYDVWLGNFRGNKYAR